MTIEKVVEKDWRKARERRMMSVSASQHDSEITHRGTSRKQIQRKRNMSDVELFTWIHDNCIEAESGCWEWQGKQFINGYGRIILGNTSTGVHRKVMELVGVLPENSPDLCVCHKCDNKICCNPDHLFLGSTEVNQQDKVNKGRQAQGESNGQSKLSKMEVMEIRDLLKCGRFYQREVGAFYNITQAHVSTLDLRKAWK